MTDSATETVLKALYARLDADGALPAGTLLERNAALPARIPGAGAVILRDGDPGQPERTMSPLTWHYVHRAEIDILVDRPPYIADATFDTLRRAIGAVIDADRTLGGICDWVEGEAPAPLQLSIEGAEQIKAATITVELHYASTDSLR